MLDKLSSLRGCKQKWRRIFSLQLPGIALQAIICARSQWFVNGAQQFSSALTLGTNDDAVGMQKVHDRRAFAEELGIRRNVEKFLRDAIALDHAANPLVRIYRHSALFNDDLIVVDRAGDFTGDCVYV